MATSEFQSLNLASCKGLHTPKCSPELQSFLTALQTNWTAEGQILKNGSRSVVTRIQISNSTYVAKIYKRMPLNRRLRYAFTQSRAFQSWTSGHAMLAAGVPIARPIAIIEERPFGIPARAALILEDLKGKDLLELVTQKSLNATQLQLIAAKLRTIFTTMRENQITHGDLKATNIIIDDSLTPTFIDIDAARIHKNSNTYHPASQKDRKRFMANWQTHPEAQEAFRDVFGKTL